MTSDRVSTAVLVLILVLLVLAAPPAGAQVAATSSLPPLDSNIDYPARQAGILVESGDAWLAVPNAYPAKVRAKNGIASSFTYGAVPAIAEADYAGEHSGVQLMPGRPIFCICHVLSIPGEPLLVRLHPQKGIRALDGGRIPILRGKVAEAGKNAISFVAEVVHPEENIWLVRPRETLPPGEYALMLGAKNLALFTFGISPDAAPASPQGRLRIPKIQTTGGKSEAGVRVHVVADALDRMLFQVGLHLAGIFQDRFHVVLPRILVVVPAVVGVDRALLMLWIAVPESPGVTR